MSNINIQEDHDLWESKLPTDYKEIIQMSKCPEIYSTVKKEELCNNFSKGILLKEDKVVMSYLNSLQYKFESLFYFIFIYLFFWDSGYHATVMEKEVKWYRRQHSRT